MIVEPPTESVEEWKPIHGYEGLYEVSDMGKVRSLERYVERKNGSGQLFPGKILKGYMKKKVSANDSYYRTLFLCKNGKAKQFYVHHIVLEAFKGPRPDGMCARYLNDISTDNRIENLEWGTLSDNQKDRIRNGHNARALQTHCKRGHALQIPNLTKQSIQKGNRACLACKKSFDYLKRRQELKPHIQEISDAYYSQIMEDSNAHC